MQNTIHFLLGSTDSSIGIASDKNAILRGVHIATSIAKSLILLDVAIAIHIWI